MANLNNSDFENRWLSDAKINVTPEVMIAKANILDKKITKLETKIQNLETRANDTVNYWQGEAGDIYRKKYHEFKEDTDVIIKRLKEHVRDLNTMAGVYESTEQEIEDIVETLPIDVII